MYKQYPALMDGHWSGNAALRCDTVECLCVAAYVFELIASCVARFPTRDDNKTNNI